MSINTQDLSDFEEIDRLEQAIQSFMEGRIDPERFTAMRLQQGVYGQRQEDVNMLRIKIPGGRLNPEQLDAIADVTETYSRRGTAHVTTRQSVQVHHVPLVNMPSAMRVLARVKMTSREACGNTIRNMSACALSGVCPSEHVDVSAHIDGATVHFLRNPLNQQLPRKFKISFSGCESDCAQSLLHDAGVVALRKNGQYGFMVKAGGGLGHKPHESIVVEEFLPEQELLLSLEALVALHNKYSDRTKRAKSRLKFLVDRFGVAGFVERYREEFARTKQALADQPYPRGEWHEQGSLQCPGPGSPRMLFAQRQHGLSVFPVALPIGEITPRQLRGIAALLREHGLDEVHTTQDQNLIILNVPEGRISVLRSDLARLGLREPVTGDNIVACPGTSTCRLGITASTVVAPLLTGGTCDLSIRVSGCHNGCAQPETGDIGIYGEGKRIHGKLVPHYQIYLGGNGMGGGKLALKGPSIPVARIRLAIDRVQDAYLKSGEKRFFTWVHAQQADYFRRLLADLTEVKKEELHTVMQDYGEAADFRVLQLGGGECAGASQVMIGANFFEAAHEREYRNALVFQRKYDEAAQCNDSILRLLGSGLVQLVGGNREDDLGLLVSRLRSLLPGSLADEFAHAVSLLTATRKVSQEDIARISAAVDHWTANAATFATEMDAQLDLTEAAAGLSLLGD